ncbi:MAG: iron-containing alcohol dehydrogenase [Planctomycetota bacterium]|jgi:glycerol dehydrogenase-like iron-containing ADH family enzyme
MTDYLPIRRFGRHLIEELTAAELARFIIYTQDVPWKLYGERFAGKPVRTELIEEIGLESLNGLLDISEDFDTVVAFGGGLAIDSAKYVAWKTSKRFIAIPTVVSADVSVCRAVAVREGWKVRYIGDKMPDELIIDFDIIQSAPAYINRGGVCDILSCYTALRDWEISRANIGEPIDAKTVAAAEDLLARLFSHREDICRVTENGIRFLVEGYIEEVRLCEEYGNPRPEEGSEHFFAYNLEQLMQRPFLHGNIVSLGVVLMTILQGRNPQEVVDFLDGALVLWRPKDAGLSDEDVAQAIETLYDYCLDEEFYYTVINCERPDRETALELLNTLGNL